MKFQSYKPGEAIFREGDESDAAYLIVSGNIRIVKGNGPASQKELAVVRAGEYIGEMGAIDNQPRSASAIAEDTVVCAPITPAEFMNMLRGDSEEAIELLKILFERLRQASRKLAGIERADFYTEVLDKVA